MTTTNTVRNAFTADERVLMWNVLANAANDFRKLAAHPEYESRIRDQFQAQADMADKLAADLEASL